MCGASVAHANSECGSSLLLALDIMITLCRARDFAEPCDIRSNHGPELALRFSRCMSSALHGFYGCSMLDLNPLTQHHPRTTTTAKTIPQATCHSIPNLQTLSRVQQHGVSTQKELETHVSTELICFPGVHCIACEVLPASSVHLLSGCISSQNV